MLRRRFLRLVSWLALSTSAAAAQNGDVGTRIERLSAAGNTVAARTLVDSVLAAASEGSDDYVEALFWHAVLDSTAAGAEHSYLRLVVEYPLSRRASAALIRLAELELARQARDRAKRHLEQLRVQYPNSEHVARAQFLAAQLARDDGEPERACALLAAARNSVNANDVELRTQIVYMHSACVAPPAPVVVDSTAARDSLVRRENRPAAGGRFAIQVAAYNTQRQAEALARQLQRRGIAARVAGTSAPFRVRVGRYATREEAQRAMTDARLRGIIVDAEPPS